MLRHRELIRGGGNDLITDGLIYNIDAIDSPRSDSSSYGVSFRESASLVEHPAYGANTPTLKLNKSAKDLGKEGWNFNENGTKFATKFIPNSTSAGGSNFVLFDGLDNLHWSLCLCMNLKSFTPFKGTYGIFLQQTFTSGYPLKGRWLIGLTPDKKFIWYCNDDSSTNTYQYSNVVSTLETGFAVFCFVMNAKVLSVYINGIYKTSININISPVKINGANTVFGLGPAQSEGTYNNEQLNSIYYSFKAYNRCLTADEVMDNYLYDKSRYDK